MSHIPDDANPLDDELRGLFTQSAAQVNPRPDLAANLQQRIAARGGIQSGGGHRAMSIAATLSAIVVVALIVGVLTQLGRPGGRTGGSGSGIVVPPTATTAPTVTPVPFTVSSVDLAVSPASIAGQTCGATATFTYTATFHVPANTAGGTIQFAYTLNNGRSQTPASVVVKPGATALMYTFTSSGSLPTDHTYPAPAIVMVTSPNTVLSPSALPSGSCVARSATGPFQVTSVSMAVSPTSIAGRTCGSAITVIYTATFHLAANGPGGIINFQYTINNGRASSPASITVARGQTTASYSFTWSGALPADHTYPEQGGVIVTTPNAVNSPLVGPTGTCS